MYNREIAAQKAAFAFRNQLLTFGVLLVVVIVVWFLVITATLADPSQLWQRNRGEEYMRPYYQRRDVHAFLWAVGGTLVYYTAAILVFFLICNLLGHRYGDASRAGRIHTRTAPQLSSRSSSSLYRYWDASMPCSPETTITFIMVCIFPTRWVTPSTASLHPPHPQPQVCIFPSYIIARIVRGAYMYHYRWVEEDDEDGRVRRGVLLICQPSVLTKKLMQYFSTSARVTDMGTVYLIRIYFVALASVTLVIIATLHCSYSFLVPFIFRIVYIDE